MRIALLARVEELFDSGKGIKEQAEYWDEVGYDYNASYHVVRFAQEGKWTRAQTMIVGVWGEGRGEAGYRIDVETGCPADCGGHGICTLQGECECNPGYLGIACHFPSIVSSQLSSPLSLYLPRNTWTLLHLSQPYKSFTLLIEIKQDSGRVEMLIKDMDIKRDLPTFRDNQARKTLETGGRHELKYVTQHEGDSIVLSFYNSGSSDTSLSVKAVKEQGQSSLEDLSMEVGVGGFLVILVLGISSGCFHATFRRLRSSSPSQYFPGIPQPRIDALYPLRLYREVAPFGVADDCSICLEKYTEKSDVRVLPCLHAYHNSCIDSWFRDNQTCCLCKLNCMNLPEEEAETGEVIDTSQESFHPQRTIEVD